MEGEERTFRRPPIDRIGTVRWILTVPEIGFSTYRLGHAILSKSLNRRTLSWRLKVALLVVFVLVLPVAMGLLYLETYVLMYYGSARLGVVYHLDTHGFVLAGLSLCSMVVLLHQGFLRALNRRILRAYYDLIPSIERRQEFVVADEALLIAASDLELVVPWARVNGFRRIKNHWVLTSDRAGVFCIPQPVLDSVPERDALVDFIREKVGRIGADA